jgi:hypothetical protein
VVAVEGHRLYVDIGIDKIRAPNPNTGSLIQQTLAAFGQIDPQVFDAIFIPAGIGDFSGVYGQDTLWHIQATAVHILTAF